MMIGYEDREIGNIEAALAIELGEDDAVAGTLFEQSLFRSVLDVLAMPLMIINSSKRIVYANMAAKSFLSEGSFLTCRNGSVSAVRTPAFGLALESVAAMSANNRAGEMHLCRCVSLVGRDRQRTAAYILPTDDHCAVFIAHRREQKPILLETLRSMFGMTYTEARVAARISEGDRPQCIAESFNVSIDTIRSHLKGAYLKSGSANKTALAALVKDLAPPV